MKNAQCQSQPCVRLRKIARMQVSVETRIKAPINQSAINCKVEVSFIV